MKIKDFVSHLMAAATEELFDAKHYGPLTAMEDCSVPFTETMYIVELKNDLERSTRLVSIRYKENLDCVMATFIKTNGSAYKGDVVILNSDDEVIKKICNFLNGD